MIEINTFWLWFWPSINGTVCLQNQALFRIAFAQWSCIGHAGITRLVFATRYRSTVSFWDVKYFARWGILQRLFCKTVSRSCCTFHIIHILVCDIDNQRINNPWFLNSCLLFFFFIFYMLQHAPTCTELMNLWLNFHHFRILHIKF